MRSFPSIFKHHSAMVAAMILAGSIVLWSVPATAAGFFLPTRGVEATGRGGASIAPHRADLDAIWYNPAGLSLLEDRQLTVDFALVGLSAEHQRAPRTMDDGSTRTYDAVENQAPPNTIPQILVGGPTPHPDINWAVGAYTHYTGGSRYPVDGAQRYALVDNGGSALGYLHAAIGWQLSDDLAVGAGLQNFMGSFRLISVGSGYTGMFGDPEDEDLDILAEFNMTSLFSPTANLGMTYWLHDRIQTGLSLQLPHIFRDGNATIDARIPEHPAFDNAEITDNHVDISVPFPLYVRGGIRYVGDRFDAEISVVYQHWSILDNVTTTPHEAEIRNVPGVDSIPVRPLVVPRQFRNTFSAHLGGEYRISQSVDVRAGYVFERGAVPDSHYNVFSLDPDKHQLSAGASYDFGPFTADASVAGVIMPSKTITDSEVRQLNPSDDGEHTLIIANGTYDHFAYIAGLAVRYGF